MTPLSYLMVVLAFFLPKYTFSLLECVYCPAHSTEAECNEMNMTQICINETKCGFARFIEKRRDRGELYPEDFNKEVYLVTVKKGCMEEDYCTKMKAMENSLINSTECVFCDEDMCDLQLPILCVECDEAEDKYCEIQSGPIKQCSPGEVCFKQRLQGGNYTQKRGCMESSRCLKQDLCEFCDTDICWTDPIPAPSQQTHQSQHQGNVTIQGKKISLEISHSTSLKPHLLILTFLLQFSYKCI